MKVRGFLVVLAALMSTSSAIAQPEDPPGAHLRHRGMWIQRAHDAASCWPGEDGGMGCTEARPMTWPRADRVGPGDKLKLRVHWKRMPRRVFIYTYRDIYENGKPKGEGRKVDWHMAPVWRNGEVRAWDIVFRVRAVRKHYVSIMARYPDTVVWNVHVRVVQ